jgi:aminoglycoside phosphotransferase (APT) family kinase protein
VNARPDPGCDRILRENGLNEGALLGAGGEARVYALDEERVLRVPRVGQDLGDARSRQLLVDELGSQGAPFFLPELLLEGEIGGRVYAIERRLPGRTVSEALQHVEGRERVRLIEAYLEASAALGTLHLEERGWFGELLGEQPVRAPTWHDYLRDRAAGSLWRSTPDLQRIDPAALAADLPVIERASFVHLDAYAGNMLTDHGVITAVLDFGSTSVVGDQRLDPIASAVYLSTPLITPANRPNDERVVMAWLSAAGLVELVEPVRRWLAAFWAFAVDDPRLHEWCRSVLTPDS